MPTNLLVFNCGSSSTAYKIYRLADDKRPEEIVSGKAYHVGVKSQESAYLLFNENKKTIKATMPLPNHRSAAQAILARLKEADIPIQVVGHRFVHGGTQFRGATLITPETMPQLEACSPLAPIHNPNSLSVIRLCQELLPEAVEFAVFDTAFHAHIPEKAYRYAIPVALADRFGYRKYGFHGLSYQYVTLQTAAFLGVPLESLKIVACHLGTGGSSVAAIENGHSLDTSMGYSPLPGLIMNTRSGDIDPTIVLDLIGEQGYSVQQVNDLLNKESGLIGISGKTSDLFELFRQAEAGDSQARLAVDMYVHRLRSYVGASLAVLEGADVLVFTDDIGVRGWQVRERACAGMEWAGIVIDEKVNRTAAIDRIMKVSAPQSKVTVLSVPTDEEYVIALEGARLLKS
jgi:acetate kinase